jgi:hypothetical protein
VLIGKEAPKCKFIYRIDMRRETILEERERVFDQNIELTVLKDNCLAVALFASRTFYLP